jgi:branched-chain amino acid transport system ATP-binding protein
MTRSPAPVLKTNRLAVAYGGLRAVRNVSLTVQQGQVVGLIGPNGAGKTTFLDAVTGYVRSKGTVELNGTDISGWRPHKRTRAGVSRSWQSVELFDQLSGLDNLRVARDASHRGSAGRGREEDAGLTRILDLLDIGDVADQMPGDLPNGKRKLLGVARALASGPALLCMDEPAAGLDSTESAALGKRLRGLVTDQMSILLIEHDMNLIFSVCDWVYVLVFGSLIAEGPPAEIRKNEQVISAYIGGQRPRSEEAPVFDGREEGS